MMTIDNKNLRHEQGKSLSLPVTTISNKIVNTLTVLTPYFVTVIPFCPPSLPIQPPSPPNNVVPQLL